jgi:hypothetical protein
MIVEKLGKCPACGGDGFYVAVGKNTVKRAVSVCICFRGRGQIIVRFGQ